MSEAFETGLPKLLPAHEVMAFPPEGPAEGACDLMYIQGRGDRLHAFALIERGAQAGPDLTAGRAHALEQVPANWLWLVLPAERAADADVATTSEQHALGLVAVKGDGTLSIVRQAPPRPGIFIRKYPAARKDWRKRAAW